MRNTKQVTGKEPGHRKYHMKGEGRIKQATNQAEPLAF